MNRFANHWRRAAVLFMAFCDSMRECGMVRARYALVAIALVMPTQLGCKPRGDGYRAWVVGTDMPAGCSRAQLIETSADIDRAGKLSNLLEVVVPFGEEVCSD
jgi:hypothetical protein